MSYLVFMKSSLSFSFTGRPLIARRPVKEKERNYLSGMRFQEVKEPPIFYVSSYARATDVETGDHGVETCRDTINLSSHKNRSQGELHGILG